MTLELPERRKEGKGKQRKAGVVWKQTVQRGGLVVFNHPAKFRGTPEKARLSHRCVRASGKGTGLLARGRVHRQVCLTSPGVEKEVFCRHSG